MHATSLSFEQCLCPEETRIFFDVLTHDDRSSRYIVSSVVDGRWREASIRAKDYSALHFPDTNAHYLTRNGFSGKHRTVSKCRQVNAIMFDIDAHGEHFSEVVPRVIKRLQDAFSSETLPSPNLLVNTGRGVQMYYVLDRSTPYRSKAGTVNEAGIAFVHDVERALGASIKAVISDISGAELDESVYDLARVGRIPGSYNAKARRRAVLLSYSHDYWTLADLKAYVSEYAQAKQKKAHKPSGRLLKFNGLMVQRLKKVEELQTYRQDGRSGCLGSRENMCFVYYNSATQIYGSEEALRRTLAFNAQFDTPLPKSDVEAIQRTVDNVVIEFGAHKGEQGFYPLKAANVIEKLHMTSEEISGTSFFASKQQTDREAAKARTAERRDARNQKICRLYGEGLSQSSVANVVGCSVRTVASVVKAFSITKGLARSMRLQRFAQAIDAKTALSTCNYANLCLTSYRSECSNCLELLPVLDVSRFEFLDGEGIISLSPPLLA